MLTPVLTPVLKPVLTPVLTPMLIPVLTPMLKPMLTPVLTPGEKVNGEQSQHQTQLLITVMTSPRIASGQYNMCLYY